MNIPQRSPGDALSNGGKNKGRVLVGEEIWAVKHKNISRNKFLALTIFRNFDLQ